MLEIKDIHCSSIDGQEILMGISLQGREKGDDAAGLLGRTISAERHGHLER